MKNENKLQFLAVLVPTLDQLLLDGAILWPALMLTPLLVARHFNYFIDSDLKYRFLKYRINSTGTDFFAQYARCRHILEEDKWRVKRHPVQVTYYIGREHKTPANTAKWILIGWIRLNWHIPLAIASNNWMEHL